MWCERLEAHSLGSEYGQDMQALCYYFCQYLLQGAMQIRLPMSYPPHTELPTHKTTGNNVLVVKINRQPEKQFLWTQGLIKQKSPLSLLSNWRLTIEGWSTASKMGKPLGFFVFFFCFPNIYFLDSRFLTIQSRAICLQSTIFPFFLFFVFMCITLFLKLFAAGCHLNDCQ